MTSPSGGSLGAAPSPTAASATATTSKPSSPSPRDSSQAQLGVVLDDEQSEDRHVDPSMAPAT